MKTRHISIMNLNFCLVFFTLLTFSYFTSALKCYECENLNPDGHIFYNCTSLDNLNSWKIVGCSGSCWSNHGNRFAIKFINGKIQYCQNTTKSYQITLSKKKSHCYFTRLNLRKMGPQQFCLQVFLGKYRHPKQKEFLNSCEGFLRAALTGHSHPSPF